MRIHAGTSGYSYKEWKGTFYPEKLPASAMLAFYGERFSTVEINNTFYRMPAPRTFEQWAAQVPPDFRFAVKAPQRITHQKRLADCEDDVAYLVSTARILGERLGPILFQLPPYFRKDLDTLRAFVERLPEGCRAAFEFRHGSWDDPAVLDVLRSRNAALCIAETDEHPDAAMVPTASWGYVRFRRTEYREGELAARASRVRQQPWEDAFVFFKHEDEGKGPEFARGFLASLEKQGG